MCTTVPLHGSPTARQPYHTAASQHVKILRGAGVVEAVLVDQDDTRLTHQRLNPKHLVTDKEGKQWLDFGKVRICLD